MSGQNGSGGGPCGACKFLRRKCVKGCIFAPYFDSDQGTTHFAAVHKVFGASNASKMILRIPPHKRLDAVVTLCYEALARVKDPVYGCVGHIFTLQQQVVNMQAELAYVQARISTLHRIPPPLRPPPPLQPLSLSSSNVQSSSGFMCSSNIMTHFDTSQSEETSTEIASFCNAVDEELEDGDLQSLYVSRCLNGVKFRPSTSH